jgi:radical SAM superfamily enzyme YgiQ (UPF0313 family)
LLLRVTRNCPWNLCEFCRTYKGERYSARSIDEVKADIDIVKALAGEIKAASWHLGFAGEINEQVIMAIINSNPELYGRQKGNGALVHERLQSLFNVFSWLGTGGKTVFLQDANTPQMRTDSLIEILRYIKQSFPTVERITSYARSKTIIRKTAWEMKQLCEAGLSRIHIGLESGCDEVLAEVKKGVTGEEHIIAGKKTKEAGITLSEYIMPGLGGKKWSQKHALESAYVLNEIDPDFIRLRTFVPRSGTPMRDRVQAGQFEVLTEDEVVEEIGLFIENLNCNSYLTSDQICNLFWEIEGRLPEDKPAMLQILRDYLQKPVHERLKFQLQRRLSSYLSIRGQMGEELAAKVKQAAESINLEAPEAANQVNDILMFVKQAFI